MAPRGGKGRGGPPPGLPPGLEDVQADSQPQGNRAAQPGPPSDQLQNHIADTIGSQVRQMISQAKNDSEVKVKRELSKVHSWICTMDEMLDTMLSHLDKTETPQVDIESATVRQLLGQIEQQWTKELGLLKQELHQTILAHNHNADLMKHQKDMLETIRQQMEDMGPMHAEQINGQLQKVDILLKGRPKQKNLEPLFQRLAVLEQRVATSFAMQMARPPFPLVPPGAMLPPGTVGMPPTPGMPPGTMVPPTPIPLGASPAGQLSQKPQKGQKGANDKKGQKNDKSQKGQKPVPEPRDPAGAYKRPTDEELQERLQSAGKEKGSKAKAKAGAALSKEAPAFVPDGMVIGTPPAPKDGSTAPTKITAGNGNGDEEPKAKEGKSGKHKAKSGNSTVKDEEKPKDKGSEAS